MPPIVIRSKPVAVKVKRQPPDLSALAKTSRSFFTQNKLEVLAKHIPTKPKLEADAEEKLNRAGKLGLEPTLIFPACTHQLNHIAAMVRQFAAAPCDALTPEYQYCEPFIQDLAQMKESAPRSRPAGAYVLCIAFGAFEDDTLNLGAKAIDKLFDADELTGLSMPEYLAVQRLRAIENGDHRFHDASPLGDEYPAGWQWLLDTRNKEGVATGFWNNAKRRVELSWSKPEVKNPKRGAHRTIIIECV